MISLDEGGAGGGPAGEDFERAQDNRSRALGSNPGRGTSSEAEGETSMMRESHPRSAAGWSLALALLLITPPAGASDWLRYWPWGWSIPQDPKMAAIVAAVRVEEAKYKDLEYVARITVRDLQRQGPRRPIRHHDAGPTPRRLPGGPDLLPARGVRARRGVEVSPRGDLGLRRRADAHGRRRQLRQHPPGPLATPVLVPRAQPAPGPQRVELPALDLPGRDRARSTRTSGIPRGSSMPSRGRPSAGSRRISRARRRSTASAA